MNLSIFWMLCAILFRISSVGKKIKIQVYRWSLAYRLQCHIGCKIQNGCQGAPNWLMGSENGSMLFWFPINFRKISFFFYFDWRSCFLRKGCDGEWKIEKEKRKIMTKIVTTNFIALQPSNWLQRCRSCHL